ncbi:Hypothetical protein NTJ_03403 [Nesidiocoris tenuis]|uniref:Uncharacterized protein n=1 Tax=Nesidiocoris tenuis TaxID=355587 RepID=A0ABN7AE92_9HEMI|nr:Hypothetical protein NTJ_03403 [Nesidiocoris tenuis]
MVRLASAVSQSLSGSVYAGGGSLRVQPRVRKLSRKLLESILRQRRPRKIYILTTFIGKGGVASKRPLRSRSRPALPLIRARRLIRSPRAHGRHPSRPLSLTPRVSRSLSVPLSRLRIPALARTYIRLLLLLLLLSLLRADLSLPLYGDPLDFPSFGRHNLTSQFVLRFCPSRLFPPSRPLQLGPSSHMHRRRRRRPPGPSPCTSLTAFPNSTMPLSKYGSAANKLIHFGSTRPALPPAPQLFRPAT